MWDNNSPAQIEFIIVEFYQNMRICYLQLVIALQLLLTQVFR